MYNKPEFQKLDGWVNLLKQSKIFNITDVFLNEKQASAKMAIAVEVQSKITKDFSSLSHSEKENVRESLVTRINEIDANILSKTSKFLHKEEIPTFVYFVLGSILGYYLIDVLDFSLITIFFTFLILIGCLMYLFLSNNINRYVHNYLVQLLKS